MTSLKSAPVRVLVLHAYSAHNAGDGLLVDKTIALIREAIGSPEITVLASDPRSFDYLGVRVLGTVPTLRGWDRETRRVLRSIDAFDLVVAVGGGYLRAGHFMESVKMLLVQGPQLSAASRATVPTLYLPQSIGPARWPVKGWLKRKLAGVDAVYVRDDRSATDFGSAGVMRAPDLAAADAAATSLSVTDVDSTPVLSIRAVRGRVAPQIYQLASLLGEYDGFVQSTVGGNDDRPASATLRPRRTLTSDEFLNSNQKPRVVVAVRLHAALMAMAAGHYVIHLSYERKGYGVYQDLGLDQYVHNLNDFDAHEVYAQVCDLTSSQSCREGYANKLQLARERIHFQKQELVRQIEASIVGAEEKGS